MPLPLRDPIKISPSVAQVAIRLHFGTSHDLKAELSQASSDVRVFDCPWLSQTAFLSSSGRRGYPKGGSSSPPVWTFVLKQQKNSANVFLRTCWPEHKVVPHGVNKQVARPHPWIAFGLCSSLRV